MCFRYPLLEDDVMQVFHKFRRQKILIKKMLFQTPIIFILLFAISLSTSASSDIALNEMRLFFSPSQRAEGTSNLMAEHSDTIQSDVLSNTQRPVGIGRESVDQQVANANTKAGWYQSIRFNALLTSAQSISLIVQGVNCVVLNEEPKRRDAKVRCRVPMPQHIELRYSKNTGLLSVYSRSKLVASLKPGERV